MLALCQIFRAVQSLNLVMQKEELKRLLGEKDAWALKEVRILIKEKFNVEYSEMQVWRMLTSWNMHHAKPYVLDKRRPDDAETILKKLDS